MHLDTIVLFQVRDVPVGTIMVGDVVLQRTHVGMERETAMVLLMEELMMDIRVVREIWCVAATTARSLEHTSMKRSHIMHKSQDQKLTMYMYPFRMTAVTFQRP